MFDADTSFFTFDLPGYEICLAGRIPGKFPINFGREVLAQPHVLNVMGRIDWKTCCLDQDEETATTKDFRWNFKPYDPASKR